MLCLMSAGVSQITIRQLYRTADSVLPLLPSVDCQLSAESTPRSRLAGLRASNSTHMG